MSSRLLTGAWLIGVPALTFGLLYLEFADTLRIDTSPATAAKIHPGMTVVEVNQIIGGPPRDYRIGVITKFNLVSGSDWPNYITWTSCHGRIEVIDGRYGFRPVALPGATPSQEKGDMGDGRYGVVVTTPREIKSYCTADNIVDSVKWEPVADGGPYPWVHIGRVTVLSFAAAFALYCCWCYGRGRAAEDASPASPPTQDAIPASSCGTAPRSPPTLPTAPMSSGLTHRRMARSVAPKGRPRIARGEAGAARGTPGPVQEKSRSPEGATLVTQGRPFGAVSSFDPLYPGLRSLHPWLL
jgi:hypothetical protein